MKKIYSFKMICRFFIFVVVVSCSIWYLVQIPSFYHWTYFVPWFLSVMFFVLWRQSKFDGETSIKGSGKRRIKKYI